MFVSLNRVGIFCSFILVVVFVNPSIWSKLLSLFITVYFSSFIVTSIGFGSVTLTITVYVLVVPFWAVTVILNLFSPSLTLCVPAPDTLDFESSAFALIFIFVVLAPASTL